MTEQAQRPDAQGDARSGGTMRAAVQDSYTGPWRTADVPVPVPGAGEVLVRVEAAGVDRGTWHLAAGEPYLVRPFFGVRGPRRPVPGRDLSGVVVAVGPGVTCIAVGDRVLGVGRGAFAELAVAPERTLVPVPAGPHGLTGVEAAALPTSGQTAWQALHTAGRVEAGQRVLVLGASGGVGTFAVQVALAAGAVVTAVTSAAKADVARALHADHVVTHDVDGDGPLLDAPHDLVVDVGGCRPVGLLRRLTTRDGTVVVVGGESGGRWTSGYERLLRVAAVNPFVPQRLVPLTARDDAQDLARLVALVEEGLLRPVVDRVEPLDRAQDAVAHVGAGRARGKVVVRVGPTD